MRISPSVRAPRDLPTSCLVLLLVFFAATAHAQFNGPAMTAENTINRPRVLTTDPAILFPPRRESHLAAGDSLAIRVFGTTEYDSSDRVSLDGTVRLPLLGEVQVLGLSVHEAELLIATRLNAAGMFHDPIVSVTIGETSNNQTATLLGEVHGVVPVLVPKRLYDVLAVSGGLPPTASHVITIQRPGLTDPIVVDLGTDPATSQMANIPIFAGDTILTGKVGAVYIVGALKSSASIPLTQTSPLTMIQALALAGGPRYDAKLDDTKIIRTDGIHRTMIVVHMQRVLNGKDPDPILQSDDIILVPNSVIKAAIQSGGIGTALGIVSLFAYLIYR